MPDQLKQAIYIELKPSFLLLGLLVSIAILSVVSVEKLPLIAAAKWSLQLLIIASTTYYVLRDAMLSLSRSWHSLAVNVKGELTLTNKAGQIFTPVLASNSFIHPKLIILNFTNQPRLPACILLSQPGHANGHRQLRVWLNWWKFDQENDIENATTTPGYHEQ